MIQNFNKQDYLEFLQLVINVLTEYLCIDPRKFLHAIK